VGVEFGRFSCRWGWSFFFIGGVKFGRFSRGRSFGGFNLGGGGVREVF